MLNFVRLCRQPFDSSICHKVMFEKQLLKLPPYNLLIATCCYLKPAETNCNKKVEKIISFLAESSIHSRKLCQTRAISAIVSVHHTCTNYCQNTYPSFLIYLLGNLKKPIKGSPMQYSSGNKMFTSLLTFYRLYLLYCEHLKPPYETVHSCCEIFKEKKRSRNRSKACKSDNINWLNNLCKVLLCTSCRKKNIVNKVFYYWCKVKSRLHATVHGYLIGLKLLACLPEKKRDKWEKYYINLEIMTLRLWFE